MHMKTVQIIGSENRRHNIDFWGQRSRVQIRHLLHNDPDALQDHCVIMYKIWGRSRKPTYTWGKKDLKIYFKQNLFPAAELLKFIYHDSYISLSPHFSQQKVEHLKIANRVGWFSNCETSVVWGRIMQNENLKHIYKSIFGLLKYEV